MMSLCQLKDAFFFIYINISKTTFSVVLCWVFIFFALVCCCVLTVITVLHVSSFAQKTKRAPKVEVGTKTTDASLDEWLQVSVNAN